MTLPGESRDPLVAISGAEKWVPAFAGKGIGCVACVFTRGHNHPQTFCEGTRMIDDIIEGPSAWKRADIHDADYRVMLGPECLDEIRRVVDEIRAHPLPTILRTPA